MSDDEKLAFDLSDDEKLAFDFLAGLVIKEPDGTISHRYLEPGSEREKEAQAALIRLLHNVSIDLSAGIRWRLAALLDPDHTAEERKFVIRPRAPGVQPRPTIDIAIARDVAYEVSRGCKIEAAIEDAMKRYKVSRSTAQRAWKQHGAHWMDGDKSRSN